MIPLLAQEVMRRQSQTGPSFSDAADVIILFSIQAGFKPIFQTRQRIPARFLTCGAFYNKVEIIVQRHPTTGAEGT
jgi:hypothetical protein